MIHFEPNELIFPNPERFKIEHKLVIFNKSPLEIAAWTIKNPNPSLISISPLSGILHPKATYEIEIALKSNLYYKKKSVEKFEILYKTGKNIQMLSGAMSSVNKLVIKAFFFIKENLMDSIEIIQQDALLKISPTRAIFLNRAKSNIEKRESTDQIYYETNSCSSVEKSKEIQSYTCPQCLQEISFKETMLQKGNCAFCCQCPVCSSKLNLLQSKEDYLFYSCTYCRWNSLQIGLKHPKMNSLLQQLRENELKIKNNVKQLVANYMDRTQQINKGKTKELSKDFVNHMVLSEKTNDWSIQKVEDRIADTNELLKYDKSSENNNSIHQILNSEDKTLKAYTSTTYQYTQVASLSQRMENPVSSSYLYTKDNYPNRKCLLITKVRK